MPNGRFLSPHGTFSLLSLVCLASNAMGEFVLPRLTSADRVEVEGKAIPLQYAMEGDSLPAPAGVCIAGYTAGELVILFRVPGKGTDDAFHLRDDTAMFEDSTAEVFLSPSKTPADGYYHLAVSARGGLFDEFVRGGGWERDPIWDSGFAAKRIESDEDGTWSVVLQVPLAMLRRPAPDEEPTTLLPDTISFQAAAVARTRDGTLLPVTGHPSHGGFHSPEEFDSFRWGSEVPKFSASLDLDLKREQFDAVIDTSLLGGTAGSVYTVEGSLRRGEGAERVPLFDAQLDEAHREIENRVSLGEAANGRFVVVRLTDSKGMLLDQAQLDWFLTEGLPVTAVQERFVDALPIEIRSFPNNPVAEVGLRRPGSTDWVWKTTPESGITATTIDTTSNAPGLYELAWKMSAASDVTRTQLVRRLPDSFREPAPGFGFWGYHPDADLLREYRAFAKVIGPDKVTGFIYGGSIDSDTATLSSIDLGSLRQWKNALPAAQMHVMIDGAGDFGELDDADIDRIARELIDKLADHPEVDGIHFDLEPYHPEQVKLMRALNRNGWDRAISIAAGLAVSLPREQWSSCDFVVAMNYDLGRAPETFRRRAESNARAFAEAASAARRPFAIGIPVVATHHEYGYSLGRKNGELVGGSRDATMVPYVTEALGICDDLRNTPAYRPFFLGPVLWAALAKGHGVGQGAYSYHPTIIDTESWTLLIDYAAEGEK